MSHVAPRRAAIPAQGLDTPCLLLDLDRVEGSVERMAGLASAAGVRLTPDAKTHKLIQVADLQLESWPVAGRGLIP